MDDITKKFIKDNTDKYFTLTAEIVKKYGDKKVIYAFFLRKPCVYAPKLAITWLKTLGLDIKIIENFKEGDMVAPGEPLFFLEGSFVELSELETIILQKLGLPCICAYNAYMMTTALPNVSFISMVARHCTNPDMVYLAEYGVAVGSNRAKLEKANGFIGCSTDYCAINFGEQKGMGTMPHSLIGYAKSTLKAAQMYYETFKPKSMTILVDYFGKEVDDTLQVCEHFADMAKNGNLAIRLDTHGARYLQGLDNDKSYDVINKYTHNFNPNSLYQYQDKEELGYIIGMGVSVASIYYMKEQLLRLGFDKVKIVASSGFNLKKCNIMSTFKAPLDVVGTGSFIPQNWADTYATGDVISYDNQLGVKQGREFLLKKYESLVLGKV